MWKERELIVGPEDVLVEVETDDGTTIQARYQFGDIELPNVNMTRSMIIQHAADDLDLEVDHSGLTTPDHDWHITLE
jgi:hypothetical protein